MTISKVGRRLHVFSHNGIMYEVEEQRPDTIFVTYWLISAQGEKEQIEDDSLSSIEEGLRKIEKKRPKTRAKVSINPYDLNQVAEATKKMKSK